MPVNEQEKFIGPFINQVMNKLPPEKRKAYLLRPQTFLTYQSMIEKILEKDGISKEMLDEQQKRLNLMQRLLQTASPEARAAIIQENQAELDETFFALFNRLIESAVQSGQQQTAQAMALVQQELLEQTAYGAKVKAQMDELNAAVQTLQQAGRELTREKLLQIFEEAPTEARLQALVSMTRNGVDYAFFQILSEQIEAASGEKRQKLEELRTRLADLTNQIDKAVAEQMKQADAMLESILQAPDSLQAAAQNADAFESDVVMQVLDAKLREAQQKNDAPRLQKLQQIVALLQQANTPPEMLLINELIDAADDDLLFAQKLKEHEDEMGEEFTGMIVSLMNQVEQQGSQDPQAGEVLKRLEKIYRAALKRAMQKNLS
jgi:hypothetical protein